MLHLYRAIELLLRHQLLVNEHECVVAADEWLLDECLQHNVTGCL